MKSGLLVLVLLVVSIGLPLDARAGGSGLNVAVVVNQNSSNSVQLGNYYCEKRGVPPQNLLRISWSGGNVAWSKEQFTSMLYNPLMAMVADRQFSNQLDYVLLSMDVPYRVEDSTGKNSTTSALFYGFKSDLKGDLPSCTLPPAASNSYAASEAVFRQTPPNGTGRSVLVTMITATNLYEAKRTVDQGVTSDSTFPSQTVFLGKSDDRLRNVRYATFDNAVIDSRLLGRPTIQRTNVNNPAGLGYIAGYQNGTAVFDAGQNLFAPGSMADDLTSFAGKLFEPNDQCTVFVFLNAGAAGSYGSVVEPCAWLQKFPSPRNYFYQARGFSLAESYYQSLSHPYQGLVMGDPLAAPCAQLASVKWIGLEPNAVLKGAATLSVSAKAVSSDQVLQRIDLYLDGTFLRTLTNTAPAAGNNLTVTVNGETVTYRVPSGATLKSVTAGLASALNNHSSASGVQAKAYGDRIELQGLDLDVPGTAIPLSTGSSQGSAGMLNTWLRVAGTTLMDTPVQGMRSLSITNAANAGDFLELIVIKTNGQTIVNRATAKAGQITGDLVHALLASVNSDPALSGPDGLKAEDVDMHEDYPFNIYIYGTNDHSGTFNLRATSPGWHEAGLRACLRGSSTFKIDPAGTNRLDENLSDLRPRGHLYLSTGLKSLPGTAIVQTTGFPDGEHELAAVAYSGDHVQTQTRASVKVQIQNTQLIADLALTSGAASTLVGFPLQFTVSANSEALAKTELFSTGGLAQTATGGQRVFEIDTVRLGAGLHPFYALVTNQSGDQYRTATTYVRLIDPSAPEAPFELTVDDAGRLTWPATAGRTYEVLKAASLQDSFRPTAEITATNSPVQWTDSAGTLVTSFYRVRTVQR